MARCNCKSQTCSCVIQAGPGVTIDGAGTAVSPWVISAEGGESTSGWFPGDIKDTHRATVDPGWLECNGQAVSRITYADLYAAIGTGFGPGDGLTTFNLPDDTGRALVGSGSGYTARAAGGAAQTILTVENLPPHHHRHIHTHPIDHDHLNFQTADGGQHTHDIEVSEAGSSNASVAQGKATGATSTAAPVDNSGAHHHQINVPPFDGSSGNPNQTQTEDTGEARAFSRMPPYRVTRRLIKT